MKEQRLVVSHEEMIELQVEVRHKERDPEQVGCHFVNSSRHDASRR
jgi:hypothetical protein